MRKLLCIAALAASLFVGAASAQTAQAGAQARVDASVPVAAQADAHADARVDATAAVRAPQRDPNCLKQTGSRLSPRAKQGCAGYGRSYDRQDLTSTGEADVGQALRKLDPRVR